MTIKQCEYVLKIAECGSFNEAAKQLFVAQSSLSVSVKSLEKELGITIFNRAGSGVYLTEQGAEFERYARQLAEQSEFIKRRYQSEGSGGRLFIATQHYDFVADVFTKLLNKQTDNNYRFSLRELKTYDVIKETENAYCDLGIIAIKSGDYSVMERYIVKKGLIFCELFKARPHVYIRKDHPLCEREVITREDLTDYPYISYEQGEHGSAFFTEEIADIYSEKHIEISDRATLMNVLLATKGYTIGTGVMPSLLSGGRIVSVPFSSDDYYSVGYIIRNDKNLSAMAKEFISDLEKINRTISCG